MNLCKWKYLMSYNFHFCSLQSPSPWERDLGRGRNLKCDIISFLVLMCLNMKLFLLKVSIKMRLSMIVTPQSY